MKPEYIFLIIWLVGMVGIAATFIIKGRKSLQKFPNTEISEFEYVENFASGYSMKSFITKAGGAKNALSIRVTKGHLWLTTNTFMAWIAELFDLLHLIPIASLKSVDIEGDKINLGFYENGVSKKIVLLSKNKSVLVELLKRKMNDVL